MTWNDIFSIVGPILGFMYWFYSRLDRRFDKIDLKFEKIDGEIKELRTGLNRIEGAFYAKDCCVLKHDKKNSEDIG